MWHEIIAIMDLASDRVALQRLEAEIEADIAAYRERRQIEIDEIKERIAWNESLCKRY